MKPAETRSDNELIQRCLGGDQDAWKDLISQYQRLVYSIANQFCPQPEDASDIFQQVWLALYQHLSELRNVQALPAWLITVTRYFSTDEPSYVEIAKQMEMPVASIGPTRARCLERLRKLLG